MPKATTDSAGRIVLPASPASAMPGGLATEYWLEMREGDIILHPRQPNLQRVYVEPATKCNLNCRTCIRNVWEDPEALMDEVTFARLLDGLRELNQLQRVVFTGFGEPLAHPRIVDMIAAVRGLGVAVTVGSNGLLLEPALARELVRLGVDRLMVSLDGAQAATYADIRGTSVSPVIDNIRAMTEIKREMGSTLPLLGFEFVALRRNVDELPALTRVASKLGATRVLVSNVLAYTRDMYEEILYGYEPQAPLPPRGWPVRIDDFVAWGNLELPRMHWSAHRSCRFVQQKTAVVGWDGAVTPCYALSHNYRYFAVDGVEKTVKRYPLGSVNEQSLAEIWMSEEYVRFRGEVKLFQFPSCPDCDLRASCDLRERNEGCWGWSPSCADCLWAQDIVRCP